MRSSTRQTLDADGIEGVSLRYGGFYGPGAASGAIVELLRRRRLPVLHGAGVISLSFTTSMRVSNAKARWELGWAPAVPSWREGIPLVAAADRNAA